MYQFQYDNVKPKYDKKAKLCVMYTDSFIVYIKIADIYKDVTEENERRFDTYGSWVRKAVIKSMEWKGYWLNKWRIRQEKITEFVGLTAKTFSYLTDDDSENKKRKKY